MHRSLIADIAFRRTKEFAHPILEPTSRMIFGALFLVLLQAISMLGSKPMSAGRWYTFDARHNKPPIGRILITRGRDATDVAIVTSFGQCTLVSFKVITNEVTSAAPASP
jgi:hypothetical protein